MTDRDKVLKSVADSEDRLFLSSVCDKLDKSEKIQSCVYTRFVTPRQAMLVKERLSGYTDIRFFGGYDGAERVMVSFVPNDWEVPNFPLLCIKIKNIGKKELGHRDYMGSILSLGISRELVGDIVITDEGALVFVCREISDFIMQNLTKVASSGVRLTLCENTEDIKVERNFKVISATVSSMRLDCVISAATGKSRSGASASVSEGLVSVNYDEEKNVSRIIKDGDTISLRGFGKMIVNTDLYLTKKGRIHINIRKYI